MNDREFIELLNLYIDHEIGPEDSARLEAEVASRPDRREVYRQYCKIQKACTMLSEEFADAPAGPAPETAGYRWGLGASLAGLAAACAVAFFGLRTGGYFSAGAAARASHPAATAAVASVQARAGQGDDMQPVFVAREPSAFGASVFVSYDPLRQAPQLNWIGAVQFKPVATSPSFDMALGPKAGLKATMLGDSQAGRDTQQPGEMAAFRFQR